MAKINELNPNGDRDLFSRVFRETLDRHGIQGKSLAQWTGRTPNNISRIRQGEDSPRLSDFFNILLAIEEHYPGFFEEYCRALIGQARRMTTSPEEFVKALDSSEFAALMIAVGQRMVQV
ncbi:MAG: hypothetical protein N5P05_003051 [Chroococcopsis gigantea SAG 12.99]|jgi:predicted transcriptional regulator|nr:hypothetical protein [Chlorogloea purpurea SAG 13.99]MDV3001445.1 hypothetical protein [Chroococcopsis gigantea SAG 12.99]